MRYVPYGPTLEGVPNVIVDGWGNTSTVLVLSHWPRNKTPPELKADTSTEIALNYARSPQRDSYHQGAQAVSNNHFDVDGLMSMWTVLHPDEALARADLLTAVGECGDFDRWSGERATKVTCAIYGLERLGHSSVHQGLAGKKDYFERTEYLYQQTLPLVPDLLDEPGRFEDSWRDEYARVQADRELFARGAASLQEVPELDLAIFDLPRRVHDMAMYEQTDCTRVAIALPGQRYTVRYRYESWVELQSRRPPPRIELKPFANLLQTFEGNDGDWVADEVNHSLPKLRLRGPGGSSITPGLFMRLLASFLRDNAENPALLWSPQRAGEAYLSQLASD